MNSGILTRLPDLLLLFLREFHLTRIQILLETLRIRGSWNREEVITLCQNPRERQLAWCYVLLLRNLGDMIDQLEILGEVLAAETRCPFPEVAFFEVVWASDLTTQHTPANGRVGDDGTAEFAASLQDANLLALNLESERSYTC